jgi:hypothetical protein
MQACGPPRVIKTFSIRAATVRERLSDMRRGKRSLTVAALMGVTFNGAVFTGRNPVEDNGSRKDKSVGRTICVEGSLEPGEFMFRLGNGGWVVRGVFTRPPFEQSDGA